MLVLNPVNNEIKPDLDDIKINKALKNGSVFKQYPSSNLVELAKALGYIHKYFCFDFVLRTDNEELIRLINNEIEW